MAPPLIPGYASPDTQACIIIPARNEEQMLPQTLDALRQQRRLDGSFLAHTQYEIIVLLNNCTDLSQSVAEHYHQTYPAFQLHIANRTLRPQQAHVGTARRLLMDTACHRLSHATHSHTAILSTDADTVVAPDWIARNLAAIEGGADVVGGVINVSPNDLLHLAENNPGTYLAYKQDRQLQALVAQLESILDPDPADPWPRHLQHFGASLACTPKIYIRAGGVPPVKPLEDVAFVDALRRVGARIRHCPDTHIFTSARLDGRAEVGLSGQLKIWQMQSQNNEPHIVDSAQWMEHRFRELSKLRCLNRSSCTESLLSYPKDWRLRIEFLHAKRLPTYKFLELLDCNALIEELFVQTNKPRHAEISEVIAALTRAIAKLATPPHARVT